ncbi:Thioredoxin-like 3-3 [Linum perenne]
MWIGPMEGDGKNELQGSDLPANRHGNLRRAETDETHLEILRNITSSRSPAVINYGASWCSSCNRILPAFLRLSNDFPKLSFVYADIDECPETTHHIRFTPSFHFYRDGEKVDEMIGVGEDRLHDRLWLHS